MIWKENDYLKKEIQLYYRYSVEEHRNLSGLRDSTLGLARLISKSSMSQASVDYSVIHIYKIADPG